MSIFVKGVTAGLTTAGQHLYQLLIGDTNQDVTISLPLRQADYARLVALITAPLEQRTPQLRPMEQQAVDQPDDRPEGYQPEFLEMDNPVQSLRTTRTRVAQAQQPTEEPDLGESMEKEIQLDRLPRMPRPGRAKIDIPDDGLQEVDFGSPLDFGGGENR